MTDSLTPELPSAAIVVDGSVDVDTLIAEIAAEQQRAGRRVRGLVMKRSAAGSGSGCSSEMVLVDVATRDEYLVSLPLGRDSRACRADTQGFARASAVLRAACAEAPDLVVCNRFGNLEAEGKGFAAELLDLMAAGIPLLTAVALRHVAAWERFSGGAQLLPAERAAVTAWLAGALAPQTPQPA